ncbi:MAG: preprotein translocase subunit SecY [Thermoguttaceae bacterium]|jgi:preprotein translocase subunit SecY|nr:preprotein translocase subunit SecY [Thermoguttaceae bacterium]
MWEKIRVIFTIPELRQKILLTLGLLAVYRIGWQIPLPIVDHEAMTEFFREGGPGGLGDFIQMVQTFSASQLSQATIFGLGIMPYISASIIFQLLATVYPPLEKLQKEGESGRKKINEYTRYATVVLCFGQSWAYVRWLASTAGSDASLIRESILSADGGLSLSWQLTAVLTMTAGTVFLMWLGEQIDEYGIGNGISLLIMAGILARMPAAGWELLSPMIEAGEVTLGGGPGQMGVETLVVLAALFVGVVAGVVFITLGQRRIPTQSAKHVRGRRVYGGTRQYLPLRVNQAGVMPIIFASSLLLIPSAMFQYLTSRFPTLHALNEAFRRGDSFIYNVLYVALIYFFCYFWTAITFNPKDMADNLKNYGTFIPGYRPGRRTADYLEKVMVRITYVGAAFLALVAITPTIVAGRMGISYSVASFYGGTGLLIAVSVAFDLVQKIDNHLLMRNYKGLLEKG